VTFKFGKNWQNFLSVVDDDHVKAASRSLKQMLEVDNLVGRSFLDAGCGSGLFSLAALQLGASHVLSFDADPDSVACALELRRRFCGDAQWEIGRGDVLDSSYVRALGTWDVVYCWGVLHHTGDMWRGLDNIQYPVASRGRLFLSIYNDQGLRSRLWKGVKRTYNRLPEAAQTPYAVAVMLPRELMTMGIALARFDLGGWLRSWSPKHGRDRGMSRWHDLIDWVGGYPFEVARPEHIFDFFRERGFNLVSLRTCGGGLGCNQFVFERAPTREA
jgi:2-polyprenyl-3-methyl-5-hydroxy-6-metoxy-1,4-benzoquinol methylase